MSEWQHVAQELEDAGLLLIQDGNHGEYRPRPDEFDETGTMFIRAADMSGGTLKFDSAQKINQTARARIRKGIGAPLDAILSHKGTVGKVAFAPAGSPSFVCSPQTTFWRSLNHEVIDPRYLYNYLRSDPFISQLRAIEHESDMAAYVSLTQQRRLKVTVPPIVVQRSISGLLGVLDDKIAVNERIATVSLDLAKASYLSANPSRLRTIGDLAQVFDGPHATPKKVTGGPWFLSISSLQGGILELSESAHISEDDFPNWTRRVQPLNGDVLFSYETRLGEAALMPSDIRACLGRRMALLRSADPQVSGALLLHAFLGNSFQEEIKRRTIHGATVDRIPLKELPNWPMLLPPTETLGSLSTALSSFHRSIEHAKRESQTLATLRDTLLPQLMSGRLRVKDAEKIVEDHT
ncbi:hypothetical protein [Streptomyces mirabilis]|uniref:hypothetical protein n=1 Tax=Streptomyces mirabilis TaxID=68239 RepID=UPI0033D9A876